MQEECLDSIERLEQFLERTASACLACWAAKPSNRSCAPGSAGQRGGARQLATHLLNTRDNEHVVIHELRDFSSNDLHSAFQEIEAVSRGTRATQFMFSLSLNPPPREQVTVEAFQAAIAAIEIKLGLDRQPRAIVFHEKEGRRHAHVVWSRIDTENMKAINLPHLKLKLQDVARQL